MIDRLELLEGTCDWNCQECHLPPNLCEFNYPPDGDWYKVEYPEFFWWRVDHLPPDTLSKLDTLVPDSMDEFYPEPPPNVYRCPRCHSTNIEFRAEEIVCLACKYQEELYDFPVARRFVEEKE